MPKLTLSFASAYNERVEPLMDGTVEVEGMEFVPTHSGPSETFYRQLKFFEFDVSEMSLSSYLIARSRGIDMVAIPVFPSRRLFHTEVAYNADSGVNAPGDLVGKRIGVAEYQQTAALWTRGVIEHDFGVSQYKVHWYMERTEELSHGGATGFQPPPGISFQRIPTDKSLASMLLAGELDAAAVVGPWTRAESFVDRSKRIPGSGDWSRIKLLFLPHARLSARKSHLHRARLGVSPESVDRDQFVQRLRQGEGARGGENARSHSVGAFLRQGVRRDDARGRRRRPVRLRHQGEPEDADDADRLLTRAGPDQRQAEDRGIVRGKHARFIN
jgi:hypothetical protein